MHRLIYIVLIVGVLSVYKIESSPCLTGWNFIREIKIVNQTGYPLNNIQISLNINTESLISSGKLAHNGSDIMVVGQNGLIQELAIDWSTFNSEHTRIFFKAEKVAPGNNIFYLYYGNKDALSRDNPGAVFDFYDDFSEPFIEESKWDYSCLEDEQYVCEDQNLHFNPSQNTLAINGLMTKEAFELPLCIEMDVSHLSGHIMPLVALANKETVQSGYYISKLPQRAGFLDSMSFSSCFPFDTLDGHGLYENESTGIWRFIITEERSVNLKKAGASLNMTRTGLDYMDSNLHFLLGFYAGEGAFSVNRVRVRKYYDHKIEVAIGEEKPNHVFTDVHPGCNGPLCEGETLELFADTIPDAKYQWILPDGSVYYKANVVVEDITVENNGITTLIVQPETGGCDSLVYHIQTKINALTKPGYLEGEDRVCLNLSQGQLALKDNVGEIVHWESSVQGQEPWHIIDHSGALFFYNQLSQTTSFRAKVQNGVCESKYSDAFRVSVIPNSDAGKIRLDRNPVCKGDSLHIWLHDDVGSDYKWFQNNNGNNWQLAGDKEDIVLKQVDTSFYLRAVVNNMLCQPDTSEVFVEVNGKGVGGSIRNDTVCVNNNRGVLKLENYKGNIVYWEQLVNGGLPWTRIHHESDKLNYSDTENGTAFRAVIQNPGCPEIRSGTGHVLLDRIPMVESFNTPESVCEQDAFCAVVKVQDGHVKSWQDSVKSYSWVDLNVDKDSLFVSNISENHFYRVKMASRLKECGVFTSEEFMIVVDHKTEAGSINVPVSVCSTYSLAELTLKNYNGKVQRWEVSEDGTNPWITIDNQTDSLRVESPSRSAFYRAIVQSGDCKVKASSPGALMVHHPPEAGIIESLSKICLGDSLHMYLASSNARSLHWQYKEDGNEWLWLDNMNEKDLHLKIKDTTKVRVLALDPVCDPDTSDIKTVRSVPLPDINIVFDTVQVGEKTHFRSDVVLGDGDVDNMQWAFGDGEGATIAHPIHQYDSAGAYQVKLRVQSSLGCSAIDSVMVPVYHKPEVHFNFEDVCLYDTVLFQNHTPLFYCKSYNWDFGDGCTSDSRNPSHKYDKYGEYTVKLIVTTHNEVRDSLKKLVHVHPVPRSSFDAPSVCENESVAIVNHSETPSGAMNFKWKFGDGHISKAINPVHMYDSSGNYHITLESISNHYCRDTIVKPVKIYPLPTVDFDVEDVSYKQSSVFINNSFVDNGEIAQSLWDFGDGNVSDSLQPSHLYQSPGAYLVKLTMITEKECMASFEKFTHVFSLPVADFEFNNVCRGDTVFFKNSSTSDQGELFYQWHFGDSLMSKKQDPQHLYTQHGQYEVELIATTSKGAGDTITKIVTVYPNPQVDFQIMDRCLNQIVKPINNTILSKGKIREYIWDFGDGSNSFQESPAKEYEKPGAYEVSLSAYSLQNCNDTMVKTIDVFQLPKADYSASDVCLGEKMKFNNYSKNVDERSNYLWQFEEDERSNREHPAYLFNDTGVYSISLHVETSNGCYDSITKKYEVFPLPNVFAGNDTAVSKGKEFLLKGSGAKHYYWQPSLPLSNAQMKDPVCSVIENTLFVLTGTSAAQCEYKDSVMIRVKDDYMITPMNIITPDNNGKNDYWYIQNIESYPHNEMYIFNAWGDMVYHKKQYLNQWNGKNMNGDILPDGTYYYVLRFENSSRVFKGAITLLRNE